MNKPITIKIGIYQTTTGGSACWEIIQDKKLIAVEATTIPTMYQPSINTITIIGLLHCIDQLNKVQPYNNARIIYTTKKTANKLKKPHRNINQYWTYFNDLQLKHNITIQPELSSTRLKELNNLAEVHSSQNKLIPTFITSHETPILMIDSQEIVEDVTHPLLHSRHCAKVEEYLTKNMDGMLTLSKSLTGITTYMFIYTVTNTDNSSLNSFTTG
jgi:hypothetical protein